MMKQRMMKRNLLTSTLTVVLLLAACGESEPTANAAETSAEETMVAASAAGDSGSSPIDAMLGIPVMDEGAFNDYLIGVISEGERRTAECMLAAGFEYTPETPAINGPSAEANRDSREYAERNGFGIVAAFEAATYDAAAPLPPNQLYVANLSDGERQAYELALFGPVADEAFEDEDGFPSVGTGCKALAIEEVSEVFAVMDEFGPAAEEIFDQLQADPRMVESAETWSECMADLGYVVSDRNEVRDQLIWSQLEPVFSRDDLYVETDTEVEPIGGESIWAGFLSGDSFGPHPPFTAEGQALVDEMAEFERAAAVASFDCYEPLREAEDAIQREYELRLVEELGDAIGERLGED